MILRRTRWETKTIRNTNTTLCLSYCCGEEKKEQQRQRHINYRHRHHHCRARFVHKVHKCFLEWAITMLLLILCSSRSGFCGVSSLAWMRSSCVGSSHYAYRTDSIMISTFVARTTLRMQTQIRPRGRAYSSTGMWMMPEGPEVRTVADQLQPAVGMRLAGTCVGYMPFLLMHIQLVIAMTRCLKYLTNISLVSILLSFELNSRHSLLIRTICDTWTPA
jgi:hypothetical protein